MGYVCFRAGFPAGSCKAEPGSIPLPYTKVINFRKVTKVKLEQVRETGKDELFAAPPCGRLFLPRQIREQRAECAG